MHSLRSFELIIMMHCCVRINRRRFQRASGQSTGRMPDDHRIRLLPQRRPNRQGQGADRREHEAKERRRRRQYWISLGTQEPVQECGRCHRPPTAAAPPRRRSGDQIPATPDSDRDTQAENGQQRDRGGQAEADSVRHIRRGRHPQGEEVREGDPRQARPPRPEKGRVSGAGGAVCAAETGGEGGGVREAGRAE